MRLGQIIELHKGNLKVATARLSKGQLLTRVGALLRRRTLSPLQGRSVMIEFETETEAWAFQKLIFALPRRGKPRKRKAA